MKLISSCLLHTGVVWNLYAEIPNSSKGFEALRKAGKRLTFITNNSVRSEADYFNKMKQHSINMESVSSTKS